MKLISKPSRLSGTVRMPASKSHTIRAVAIAALAEGQSIIQAPLLSSDTLSAVNCYRQLGATINTDDDTQWQILGTGGVLTSPHDTIDVGNSGTTLRIAVGSAALGTSDRKVQFTGDHQIQSRPIGPLLTALNHLGASCRSRNNNDKPPVEVHGGLKGGQTPLDAPTSQYLTSLLLCCPLAPNDTDIDVIRLNEAGYVQMTLDWLDKQGIVYQNEGLTRFHIKGGQHFQSFDLPIPADFSSATFFLCAAALFGKEVTLLGLDFNDSQPDKAVVDYLKAMGADIQNTHDRIIIKGSALKGIDIDMNDTPDALPALAVTATFAQGATRLLNVPQARSKETDRIRCMFEELTKLGAKVEELPDGLVVHQSQLKSHPVDGRHDHRIVMALALAGLGLTEPLAIDTAEAMNITFPNFVELMTDLGADMVVAT